jgi:hypothetical protein
MSHPDALDLYNECLSIVEETTDDRTAERVLLIAVRLLQMADEDFARRLAAEPVKAGLVSHSGFPLLGFPRPPRRLAVQDDGREPAQVRRHPARLCARHGRLPGSRGGRLTVTTPSPLFAADLPYWPHSEQGRM